MTTSPLATPASSAPIVVLLPVSDTDIYLTVAASVTDRLERDWHDGRCGCAEVDASGVCVQYGVKWRDHAPITWLPETVLLALRDVSAPAVLAEHPAAA